MIFGEDTIKTIAEGIYKPADWLYAGIQKVKNLLGLGDDTESFDEKSDEEKYEEAKKNKNSRANDMSQEEYTAYVKHRQMLRDRKKDGLTPTEPDLATKTSPTETDAATAVQASGAKAEEATALPTSGQGESVPKTKAGPGGGVASGKATASTSGGKLILEVEGFDGVVAQIQNDQTAIEEPSF
jgi:hypothetical protein